MASNVELIPPGVTAEDWDAAYRRVRAYLAALGVRHEYLLHRRVQQVMERCTARLAARGAQEPVHGAATEVERQVLDWFRAVLDVAPADEAAADPAELSLRGRLAMLLADLPERWHDVFLSDPPWPEEFVQAVRSGYLEAVPDLRHGRMGGPSLDLGRVPQFAEKALLTIDCTRWLRLIVLWLGFAAFFGFVFWSTR